MMDLEKLREHVILKKNDKIKRSCGNSLYCTYSVVQDVTKKNKQKNDWMNDFCVKNDKKKRKKMKFFDKKPRKGMI